MCHDSPGLLWRRLILKLNEVFTLYCHSWLRTISVSCKAESNSSPSPSPSSSILSWKRWKGNTAFCIQIWQLWSPRWGLVLQLAGLWHSLVGWGHDLFHSTGSKECKLVHCFINTVSVIVVFLMGFFFFFFLFSLQWLEIANAQEKKEDCRGTPFPWASCRTHVQEIECKNYCMRGC